MEITNEDIAKTVMQWIKDGEIWVDDQGTFQAYADNALGMDFAPLTDIAQSFRVVYRMLELGYNYQLTKTAGTGLWICVFWDVETAIRGIGEEDTPELAINTAALKAVRE